MKNRYLEVKYFITMAIILLTWGCVKVSKNSLDTSSIEINLKWRKMRLFRDVCPGYKQLLDYGKLEPRFNHLLSFSELFDRLKETNPTVLRDAVSFSPFLLADFLTSWHLMFIIGRTFGDDSFEGHFQGWTHSECRKSIYLRANRPWSWCWNS